MNHLSYKLGKIGKKNASLILSRLFICRQKQQSKTANLDICLISLFQTRLRWLIDYWQRDIQDPPKLKRCWAEFGRLKTESVAKFPFKEKKKGNGNVEFPFQASCWESSNRPSQIAHFLLFTGFFGHVAFACFSMQLFVFSDELWNWIAFRVKALQG